jgi:hypothetical protein
MDVLEGLIDIQIGYETVKVERAQVQVGQQIHKNINSTDREAIQLTLEEFQLGEMENDYTFCPHQKLPEMLQSKMTLTFTKSQKTFKWDLEETDLGQIMWNE